MDSKDSFFPGYFIICISVLFACIGLFALDKEMHSISDFLTPGNLVALAIYYLPTLAICLSIFVLSRHRYNIRKSLILGLLTGIPIGFTVVICFFVFVRQIR